MATVEDATKCIKELNGVVGSLLSRNFVTFLHAY